MFGQCKGEKECAHCLDDTETIWLNNSKKRVHVCHRRFLPKSHAYRNMKRQFDGTREMEKAPSNFDGHHVYDQVKDLPIAHGKKGKTTLGKHKRKKNELPEPKQRWKKKSILWELPYWSFLRVRHSIDAMHVKKNVCGSLLGTLMNDKHKTKDHENARKDLEELGIRPELRCDGTGG